ncbi:MAG: alpha/beta hydrolase [Stagnimonas sp.]|nr:alpha/beta hydrolase [Stagnimonas sp.]
MDVAPLPNPSPPGGGAQNLRLQTTVVVAEGSEPLKIAAEVFVPAELAQPPLALICLPGGGMSRRYYDLQAADGDESFSFARQMAKRGYLVVTLDHAGIGDSDRPADSYALTPERVMQANAEATAQLLARLRDGSLLPALGPLPTLRSIGIGHSMGAMFTILQQAAQAQHAAIAVLGFSTRGLPEYVSPRVKELAAQSVEAVRAELVESARKMFGGAHYPEIKPNPQASRIFEGAQADPRGVEAIKAARAPLLPVPAFFSMIPGNVAPEAARISVPVFLGLGERDMVGDPQRVPAAFSASPAVELYLQPGAGHSHFLFDSRFELYDRLAGWMVSALAHLDEGRA